MIKKFNQECDSSKEKLIQGGQKAYFWQGFFVGSIYILYGMMFFVTILLVTKNVYNHNSGQSYDIQTIFIIFFALIPVFFISG